MTVSKSPLDFYLGSGSKIKVDALQEAITACELHATVTPIKEAQSKVHEQPNGSYEIFRGAQNRVLSAKDIDPHGDAYFAIENGIELNRQNEWEDYAVVLFLIPSFQMIRSVKSASVVFPKEAVELTQNKPGGFVTNTVGKTLKELGLVQRHDDPHLDLCGVSRAAIIKSALVELLGLLPQEFLDSKTVSYY